MKFVEKKCPNCGANLKFKAGERNATCESCRREFVVEYNSEDVINNLKDAADKLKAESVNLIPAAKVFGTVVAVHSIIILLISSVIIVAIIFGIINAVNSFNKINEDIRNQKTTTVQDNSFSSREDYERALKELEERQQKALEDAKNAQ